MTHCREFLSQTYAFEGFPQQIKRSFHLQTIYRYKYAHRSSRDPYPAYTGVKHGDDVEFVFGTPLFDDLSEEYQEEEVELAEDLVNYWSTFVKTGYSYPLKKSSATIKY